MAMIQSVQSTTKPHHTVAEHYLETRLTQSRHAKLLKTYFKERFCFPLCRPDSDEFSDRVEKLQIYMFNRVRGFGISGENDR